MSNEQQQIIKRNFLLNLLEGTLFTSAGSLNSMQTVLPALVAQLGGSNFHIGAVAVVGYGSFFLPQIFAARYAEAAPWKKTMTIRIGAMHRGVLLALASVLLIWGRRSPDTVLFLFFVLYGLNQLLAGMTSPFWIDFFGKLTPLRLRGRLVGLRASTGAVGALMCGLALTWLLGFFPFPTNLGVALLLAAILQFASLVAQIFVHEPDPSNVKPISPLGEYIRSLPTFFRHDTGFAAFIIACALYVLGGIPVGFYAAYALRSMHAPGSMVGGFTVAMVLVQIGSATANGFLADRYGYKIPLLVSGLSTAIASLTAIAAPSAEWFYLVFIFVGINIGSESTARSNMAIEFGTEHQRASIVGLLNTMLAPCYFVGILGGSMVDVFGFKWLFVFGALSSLAGFFVMSKFVHDPRHLWTRVDSQVGMQ